jgi:hypothetical protein
MSRPCVPTTLAEGVAVSSFLPSKEILEKYGETDRGIFLSSSFKFSDFRHLISFSIK